MSRIVLKELETDKSQSVADTEALIGRDPACGFVIEGAKSKVVSGRHARIFFQDSAWWIQDMSRNGTVLDDERLQAGQRHALRIGQTIGLGESGPRLKVITLESRNVADTMLEPTDASGSPKTTAPRQRPMVGMPGPGEGTAPLRKSEMARAGLKFEEPTEPMSPAPDWLVHLVFRGANSDQAVEAKAMVVRLGRSPECDIRIPPEQGASVSRIHAEVAVAEGGVVVRDAGSRNGTFLNGTRIHSAHPLVKGDQIMLGSGGPVLTVDDLHIVKGKPSARASDSARGIGGGPTPTDPIHARRSPPAEPATAPSPYKGSEPAAVAGTRLHDRAPVHSPARGAGPEGVLPSPRSGSSRARLALWIGVGIALLAAAVAIGRITAS
jgi:pSer/pThr/pTyr-binding forkhead associated (FHA) protein